VANDPKTDLIYAILAMDSYNRGYGSSVKDLAPLGTIGGWSILTTAEVEYDQDARDAGFYAIAYKNGDDIVISFRGTDRNGIIPAVHPNLGGSDAVNGYGIALGLTDAPQGLLALQFFEDITSREFQGQNFRGQEFQGTVYRFNHLQPGKPPPMACPGSRRQVQ